MLGLSFCKGIDCLSIRWGCSSLCTTTHGRRNGLKQTYAKQFLSACQGSIAILDTELSKVLGGMMMEYEEASREEKEVMLYFLGGITYELFVDSSSYLVTQEKFHIWLKNILRFSEMRLALRAWLVLGLCCAEGHESILYSRFNVSIGREGILEDAGVIQSLKDTVGSKDLPFALPDITKPLYSEIMREDHQVSVIMGYLRIIGTFFGEEVFEGQSYQELLEKTYAIAEEPDEQKAILEAILLSDLNYKDDYSFGDVANPSLFKDCPDRLMHPPYPMRLEAWATLLTKSRSASIFLWAFHVAQLCYGERVLHVEASSNIADMISYKITSEEDLEGVLFFLANNKQTMGLLGFKTSADMVRLQLAIHRVCLERGYRIPRSLEREVHGV